jgi:predicted permease
MLQSILIAVALVLIMVLGWLLVQLLWKRVFKNEYREEDVLAGRRSCANCGCTGFCENKNANIKHQYHLNN